MGESHVARIAVEEGLLSAVELDRVKRQTEASGQNLVSALVHQGLLRDADVQRIERTRQTTTQVPILHSSSHTRHVPDEVRAASLDAKSAFGRYTLVEKIGSGGMGVIWKAWDNLLGRWSALKLLHEEFGRHPDHRERFIREARAAARLAHPNCVQVYEVGEEAGQVFIALEYVPGETLRQRIAHRAMGPELRRRIELVRQAAEGLGSAHASGITHRDMKPENVLVLPTPKGGQAKVVDFGLAVDNTVKTRLTIAGDVFGTPAYMAPEQALGLQEIVGPPTDVFAVGCILYEVVAGKLPFDGEAAAASVYATIHSEPTPLSKLAQRVHPDLETIVMHSLEKDPSRRYGNARELAEDLGRYMAGEPILARPIGRLGRLRRYVQRNRSLAASVLAAIFLGASLLGILLYEQFRLAREIETDLAAAMDLEERGAKNPDLLTRAVGRYQSVILQDEHNEKALEGLSRVAAILKSREMKERDAATEAARKTLDRDLGEARAAITDPRKFAAARVLCDLLLIHHPDEPEAFGLRADYRCRVEDWAGALEDLDRAAGIGAESRHRLHLRTLCLIRLGQIAEARQSLRGLDDPIAHADKAALLLTEGRRDEVRALLGSLPEPTADSLFTTGLIDAASGGLKAGVAAWQAAVSFDPTHLPALLFLARGLADARQFPHAVARARDAVELAPVHPGARLVLADILFRSGDTLSALRELDRAIELAPGSPLRFLRPGPR